MNFIIVCPVGVGEEPSIFRIRSWEIVPRDGLDDEIADLLIKEEILWKESQGPQQLACLVFSFYFYFICILSN